MKVTITENNTFKPFTVSIEIETKEELDNIIDDLQNTGAWSDELYHMLDKRSK